MRKFISILLVFLSITSVSITPAAAEPAPFVAAVAIPTMGDIVITGITAVVSGAVVIELGNQLGKTWDGAADSWDTFAKDVSEGIDNLFHSKEWIKVTSQEGKTVMTAVYECWNAGGSSGGKKDDKWYFEARIHDHQIEINPKRLNEEQALKEMGRGKHIMTLNEELVKNAVARFRGLSKKEVDRMAFEGTHNPATGYFKHLHYEAQDMRLHCWSWK